MPDELTTYSSASIESKGQMELMRFRPTFGVGARDVSGQVHAIGEIFSNSKDEMPYVQNGSIEIAIFVDREHQLYQIGVSDSGRGVPLPSLVDVFTKPHTSGKYNQKAYKVSSGLFGIGAKATLATTKRFRAIAARDTVYGTSDTDRGYGSVTTVGLDIVDQTILTDTPAQEHGTLVTFQFDESIMVNMQDFIETGYQKVIESMQRFHLFMPENRFTVYMVESFLPEDYWTVDIPTALSLYHSTVDTGQCIYDSNDWADPFKYLSNIWGISSSLAWESGDLVKPLTESDILGYTIRLYLPKRISGSGIVAMVNDVYIIRADAYHVLGLVRVLKEYIGKFIEDSSIREFFFDKYKLPLYVAMDIKYSGAEFVGTTKESFRDADFLELFITELKKSIAEREESFTFLANVLMDHIKSEYNRIYSKGIEVKSEQKLMLTLNNVRAYKDCDTYGPDSELFIVEGTSASGVQTERNVKNQALYATRGKPLNAMVSMEASRNESIQKLMKDKIWQDLVRIIGIQPGNDEQDLSTLRFGKICIMHDADPDGAHIESIYVANFYLLNPNLVTKGYIWISKPPLFLLQRKQAKKYKFFMYNESAIIDYHILLYDRVFEIALREKHSGNIHTLDFKAFRSLCYEILNIGEKIQDVANRINIPDFILECLLHCLVYLDRSRCGGVDIERVRSILPFDKVDYDRQTHALIVSAGMQDYTISLNGLLKEVYNRLYPTLRSISWDSYDILVSTKHTDIMQSEVSGFIKIYKLFKEIDEMFDTQRFKGLGTMRPEDLAATCIVPDSRALFHIESLEDAQVLFDMMGNDTTARRAMLETQDLISS